MTTPSKLYEVEFAHKWISTLDSPGLPAWPEEQGLCKTKYFYMDRNLVFLYVDLPAAGQWHCDAYVFSVDMVSCTLSHLLRCLTSLTPLLRWMKMCSQPVER
jgi:hypothetical protein